VELSLAPIWERSQLQTTAEPYVAASPIPLETVVPRAYDNTSQTPLYLTLTWSIVTFVLAYCVNADSVHLKLNNHQFAVSASKIKSINPAWGRFGVPSLEAPASTAVWPRRIALRSSRYLGNLFGREHLARLIHRFLLANSTQQDFNIVGKSCSRRGASRWTVNRWRPASEWNGQRSCWANFVEGKVRSSLLR